MDDHVTSGASAGREVVPGVVVTEDGRIGAGTGADRTFVEMARFVSDTGRLLWRVARDPRVPWTAKAVAGGAVAYVVSPVDVIPDFIPGVGRLDDLWIIIRALRYLAAAAGYEVLQELWPGTNEGFALLLWLAGIRD